MAIASLENSLYPSSRMHSHPSPPPADSKMGPVVVSELRDKKLEMSLCPYVQQSIGSTVPLSPPMDVDAHRPASPATTDELDNKSDVSEGKFRVQTPPSSMSPVSKSVSNVVECPMLESEQDSSSKSAEQSENANASKDMKEERVCNITDDVTKPTDENRIVSGSENVEVEAKADSAPLPAPFKMPSEGQSQGQSQSQDAGADNAMKGTESCEDQCYAMNDQGTKASHVGQDTWQDSLPDRPVDDAPPHENDAANPSTERPDDSIDMIEQGNEASSRSFTSPLPVHPPAVPSLTPADSKLCLQLVQALRKHHSSWPFWDPVDPSASYAPDYFTVISCPMDLSTIERKLESEYIRPEEMIADVQLMLNNCFTYNPPANSIFQLGKSLQAFFHLQASKVFPSIDLGCDPNDNMTTAEAKCPGRRASKRTIKPPKVFEPEVTPLRTLPTPKSRRSSMIVLDPLVPESPVSLNTPSRTRRPSMNSTEKSGKNGRSKYSSKEVAIEENEDIDPDSDVADDGSDVDDSSEEDEEMYDAQITTLASFIETINAQLAILSSKKSKKRRRSSSSPSRSKRSRHSEDVSVSTRPQPVDEEEEDAEEETVEAPSVKAASGKQCEYCSTVETPMWRRGPSGCGTLCNKCGVKWRNGKILSQNDGENKIIRKRTPKKNTNNPKIPKQHKPRRNKRVVTYEQKTELSTLISELSEEHMAEVVDIIRSGIPHLRDTQEEIELDIDSIDNDTLVKLYDYVKLAASVTNL